MKCWQCSNVATHEFKYADDEPWRAFCGTRECGPVSMWAVPYGTTIRPVDAKTAQVNEGPHDCGHSVGIRAMMARIAQLETALNQCQAIALRNAEENPEEEGDTYEKRAHGPEWNRVALAIEYEIKALIESIGLPKTVNNL